MYKTVPGRSALPTNVSNGNGTGLGLGHSNQIGACWPKRQGLSEPHEGYQSQEDLEDSAAVATTATTTWVGDKRTESIKDGLYRGATEVPRRAQTTSCSGTD